MTRPTAGTTHTVERTFTPEEVRQFADLSGDTQSRHTDPDDEGRVLVHGLLTATLPTQIGGDLEVLARTMTFEFRRPVYTGETITCTWTHESVTEREDRYALTAEVVCTVDGTTVMDGSLEGIIWKE